MIYLDYPNYHNELDIGKLKHLLSILEEEITDLKHDMYEVKSKLKKDEIRIDFV